MNCIQACTNISSSSSTNLSFSTRNLRVMSVNRPTTYLKTPKIVVPKLPSLDLTKNVVVEDYNGLKSIPLREFSPKTILKEQRDEIKVKLYAILEAISDRIEMHNNVKEQRDNWNSLLLNSINMITLTASTMAGVSAMGDDNVTLKVSSMVLFIGATGLVSLMNKIQPSQLAQEQRNAVRLFKQLRTKLEITMSLKNPSQNDVEEYMEKILVLDRAYPLPLLGVMLEKFPETYKPAVWWPTLTSGDVKTTSSLLNNNNNGWSKELEEEMKHTMEVIKNKDVADYVRIGNKALKLNKMLAKAGPVLTGIAAIGSGLATVGAPWGGVAAAVAGSLAGLVNTMEHGGQVGMVFEMYRNCGGIFSLMEDTIETTLQEENVDKRENGELFEMKMALKLGRSLSELRDLADKSRANGGHVEEFASKLF